MKALATALALLLSSPAMADCVVLLHGLARTEASFIVMEEALQAQGYTTFRPDYPSTELDIATLSEETLPYAIRVCGEARIHVVTHSMGGILLRHWLAEHEPRGSRVGRVVMLAPPNHGTRLVDLLGRARALLGPSGRALGTTADSAPSRLNALGPVDYELGVIAGSLSLSPLTSLLLAGPDDGTVSVASARLPGMRDFLVLRSSHRLLMWDREAARQVIHFLERGHFDASDEPGAGPQAGDR